MVAAPSDPLRSTLDNLELDPRSEADRPYLVAMLRRLGYTERDIEEVIRTGRMPEAAPAARAAPPAALPADDLAPGRDFRLVVPARDSRFELAAVAAPATDAPFEDLERLEFEDPARDLEFESVAPDGPEPAAEPTWAEEPAAEPTWTEEPASASGGETGGPEALREEADSDFDATPIDTFGSAEGPAAAPRTRVRVRRVRAASKEEAERKVAAQGRNVIKSIPVDIVERWGARGEGDARSGGKGGPGA